MTYRPIIAVYGTTGALGKPVIAALTSSTFESSFQFPIRAITRSLEGKTDTDKVKYYQVSGETPESYQDVFKGVDVVISLVGRKNNNWDILLQAVKAAKPRLFIPSQFGTDWVVCPVPILGFKKTHSDAARAAGIKTVDICTSLFASPGKFMYKSPIPALTLDRENTVATIKGDPNHKFCFTVLRDLGYVVASVASRDPSSLPDTVRVYSDTMSQEELLTKLEAAEGIKFERKYVAADVALKEALERLDTKGFSSDDFGFYLQTIVAQGEGKGLAYVKSNERELVNPKETLFKWSKY